VGLNKPIITVVNVCEILEVNLFLYLLPWITRNAARVLLSILTYLSIMNTQTSM